MSIEEPDIRCSGKSSVNSFPIVTTERNVFSSTAERTRKPETDAISVLMLRIVQIRVVSLLNNTTWIQIKFFVDFKRNAIDQAVCLNIPWNGGLF